MRDTWNALTEGHFQLPSFFKERRPLANDAHISLLDCTCDLAPICAQDVTRRWSGALEKNKPRRLASTFRRSRCDRDNCRAVEHFSGPGSFGDDPATGNALGRLERNLLPDSLRVL